MNNKLCERKIKSTRKIKTKVDDFVQGMQ